jgi:hypothetical protein
MANTKYENLEKNPAYNNIMNLAENRGISHQWAA